MSALKSAKASSAVVHEMLHGLLTMSFRETFVILYEIRTRAMTALALPDESYSLVLGSSSKSRAFILDKYRLQYSVIVAPIDEKAVGNRLTDVPNDLVLRIANAKADALVASGRLPTSPAIVICADQVAVYNGKIREKPTTAAEAREYLESYRFGPVTTVGGVVVYNTKTKKRASTVDIAHQYFEYIPDEVIQELLRAGRVFECCGGFTIEDPVLRPYLGRTEGVDGGVDSIIGLSLTVVQRLIADTL
ncbi:hypothetical protein HDU83_001461 [Entophlyctis luteolus]|nr:hypothetical protein HDU83_001461 [Entophlyctis luteolus]